MSAGRLLVGLEREALLLRREADRWATTPVLEGRAPRAFAAAPDAVFCGTWGHGVWRSDDGGERWRPVGGDELGRARVMALAVGSAGWPAMRAPASAVNEAGPTGARHPGAPVVVYCGTEPSAVWRSDDGGESWRPLAPLGTLPSARTWSFPPRPHTHHVRCIAVDPAEPDRLYVCIEAGALVRTADGGATWIDRTPGSPLDTHTLVIHPLDPARLYAAAGDGWFESRDRGESWERPREGLQHGYLWSVAVHRQRPDTRIVSAAAGARQAHDPERAESYVYRRTGSGTWQRVDAGLPEPRGTTASVLANDPEAADSFWLANNRGIFVSGDEGASWAQVEAELPAAVRSQRVKDLLVLG